MPTPGNPRASANRRVINAIHSRLYALRSDLEAKRISADPVVLDVVAECLRTLEAAQETDRRHQIEEQQGPRHNPGDARPIRQAPVTSGDPSRATPAGRDPRAEAPR